MKSVITDEFALTLARAPIAAAIAAARLVGRGDERAADQAAVDAMRAALNDVPMKGRVVIGEGERDRAPMLFVGEEVGAGKGAELDIALDPLEGTTLAAKAMPNALSVIAVAPKGGLLHAPDTYMDKIAIGPGYPDGVVDLDEGAAQNVRELAKAKGVSPEDIGVCVLDRPRHGGIIEALRDVGARVHLIGDGDIAGVIHCTKPETGIDMYLGSGGAPEGVLAAAALKCVGGQFQGRLIVRNDEERLRAERAGIEDLKRRYALDDLVSDGAVFVATGVTSGSLLDGVRIQSGAIQSHCLILNAGTGTVSELRIRQPA
ncbi:MAG: class II fructose-bisphosphatase [Hyphomonadaceae bacterium]